MKSPIYNKTEMNKTKGSLNYNFKKKEAMRIDQENLAIAKRIVNQKASLRKKDFDKDYQKYAKAKSNMIKENSLEIGSIVNSQR